MTRYLFDQRHDLRTMEQTITINVAKFKEILIHSWELIPLDKQRELVEMNIYPNKQINS